MQAGTKGASDGFDGGIGENDVPDRVCGRRGSVGRGGLKGVADRAQAHENRAAAAQLIRRQQAAALRGGEANPPGTSSEAPACRRVGVAKSGGLSVRNGLRGGRAPFPPACSAFPRAIPRRDFDRRSAAQAGAMGAGQRRSRGGGSPWTFVGHS